MFYRAIYEPIETKTFDPEEFLDFYLNGGADKIKGVSILIPNFESTDNAFGKLVVSFKTPQLIASE